MRALSVVWLFAVVVAQGTAAQLVTRGDDVYFLESPEESLKTKSLATGHEREVYRAEKGRIHDYRVSPNGGLIAISEQVLKYDIPGGKPTESTTLRLITSTGEWIDDIQQARHFAWSPDGRQLAYVTGDYAGPEADYSNTATWIWNATDKTRREISKHGYYVSWAAFDGNIYLWDKVQGVAGTVYRYDILSGKVEQTAHKSIYFSPTGTYYYHPGGGIGLPENVYLRSSDSSVKTYSTILAELSGWQPLGWARDKDLLLMRASKVIAGADGKRYDESSTIVYDPTADARIELPPGQYFSWGNDSTEVTIRNGARVERRLIRR